MRYLFPLIFYVLFSVFTSPTLFAKYVSSQRGERTTNLKELVGKDVYILSINGQNYEGKNVSKGYLAYYYVYTIADTSNVQLKNKCLAKEENELSGVLTVIKTFDVDAGKKHKEGVGILVKDNEGKFLAIKIPLWIGSYPFNGATKKVWEYIERPEIEFIDSKPYCRIETLYKDSVLYKISENYRCNYINKKTKLVGVVYDAEYTKRMKLQFIRNGNIEEISCKQSNEDYDGYYDISSFSRDFATMYELKKRGEEEYGKNYVDSISQMLKGHSWYIGRTPSRCYHYKDKGFYNVKEGDYKFDGICLKEPQAEHSKNCASLYKYHLKFTGSSDTIEFYLNPQTNIMDYLVDADVRQQKIQTKEAEERRAELLEKQKEAREERIYKQRLVKRYGARNAALILDEQVRIGFTKEMCVEAWGEPQYVNSTITRFGKQEQWVYGIGCYLYFVGNKLTGIQNVE